MMKILMGGTIAAGLAAGLLWPASSPTPMSDPSREVVLSRSADRHFYAEGKVDGRTIRFLVDTGSSAVALTQADATRVGIDVNPDDFELIGEGASGLVRGKYVTVKSIDIGGIVRDDVKVAIVEGASISLLGQPFLEEIEEIVIRKGEMRLREGGA